MINLHLNVRRAVAHDQRQISSLILGETCTHRHLDWRAAIDWIGVQNFWVLENHGEIVAAFACPEDPPDIAWIRLFSHHPHLSGPEAWSALWNTALPEIMLDNPNAQVASIVMKQWMQSILIANGFEHTVSIVLLELDLKSYSQHFFSPYLNIRPMLMTDLIAVEQIDKKAFGSFWHNTFDSLQRALEQSFYSTVAEDEKGIVGYQISTGNSFSVHLARLGVTPASQRTGIASALVHNLIQKASGLYSGRLSVNTQDNNAASLNLYKRLGFLRTGEQYPVFVHKTRTVQA